MLSIRVVSAQQVAKNFQFLNHNTVAGYGSVDGSLNGMLYYNTNKLININELFPEIRCQLN